MNYILLPVRVVKLPGWVEELAPGWERQPAGVIKDKRPVPAGVSAVVLKAVKCP